MANHKSNSGFEECMSITTMLMRAVGVWPLDKDVVWPKCRFLTLMILAIFLNIIPQTTMAIRARGDLALIIDVLTTVDISEIIAVMKVLTIWHYKEDIEKLIVQIRKDWETTSVEEQREMWSRATTSKWIARFLGFSCFGLVVAYFLMFLINFESSIVYVNGTAIRPLYLKAYFFFETHRSPVYEIITIGQCIGGILSVVVFVAYDSLYVSSILHYSGQFHNLKRRLENLVEEHRLIKVPFVHCLKSVIRRHVQLVSCTDIIEDSFNKTFLVQIFTSSVVLCLLGYQLVACLSEVGIGNSEFAVKILLTTANLSSIFAYCAIAQVLRDESASLLDRIYQTEWYELPSRDAILIVIVMGRCIRPVQITVGKFSPLTLTYFAGVMKTSLGYLSVLLAVKDKIIE